MTAPTVETQTLEFSTEIAAPVEFLWSMLSNRDDLCDWLCNDASVRFREGGFATLIWREPPTYQDGPHAYGIYKTIVENEKIVMTWHDGTDQVTKVKFLIEQGDDAVTLRVWHKGFTDESRAEHYQLFWEDHLKTLKRMLETGERPAIADRVVIGVMVDSSHENEYNGQRVSGVIDGYSAAKAGLKTGDIIIEVGGTTLNSDTGIHSVTDGKRPGDELKIGFMRDGEKHIVNATLSGHPIPPIPKTFDEMAQQHQDEYDRVNTALESALDGVTTELANLKPEDSDIDTEWNINETLAHMILNQRHTLEWLSTYAHGPRLINGYYREQERIQAIVSTYGEPQALFSELKAKQQETIGMINAFDKTLEKRLDYMWWMVFEIWWSENTAMRCISEIEELKTLAITT